MTKPEANKMSQNKSSSNTKDPFNNNGVVTIRSAKITKRQWHQYSKAPKGDWRSSTTSFTKRQTKNQTRQAQRTKLRLTKPSKKATENLYPAKIQRFSRGPKENSIGFDRKYRKQALRMKHDLKNNLKQLKYFFPEFNLDKVEKTTTNPVLQNKLALKEVQLDLARKLQEMASTPTPPTSCESTPDSSPVPKCLVTEEELRMELKNIISEAENEFESNSDVPFPAGSTSSDAFSDASLSPSPLPVDMISATESESDSSNEDICTSGSDSDLDNRLLRRNLMQSPLSSRQSLRNRFYSTSSDSEEDSGSSRQKKRSVTFNPEVRVKTFTPVITIANESSAPEPTPVSAVSFTSFKKTIVAVMFLFAAIFIATFPFTESELISSFISGLVSAAAYYFASTFHVNISETITIQDTLPKNNSNKHKKRRRNRNRKRNNKGTSNPTII